MKNRTIVAILSFALVLISACSSYSKRASADRAEAVTVQQDNTPADQKTYITSVEKRLDVINNGVNRMNLKADRASGLQGVKLKSIVHDLQSRIKSTHDELMDVKQTKANDYWNQKKDVDSKLNSLEEAYNKAKPQF